MLLTKYLPSELIFPKIDCKDKWEAMERMINGIATSRVGAYFGANQGMLKDIIFSREKDISTGLGHGIGFPHARHPDIKKLLISLATLKEPIPYDSIDGKPVNIICMVLAPDEEPTLAIKVRSRIAKLLANPEFRATVMGTDDPEEIHKLIEEMALDLDVPITANDIMQSPEFTIHPSTSMKEVVRLMSEHHANTTAVINDENEIVGEITCDRLFNFGIPDFFSQLKSVSFISEFDPFEKYFHVESHSSAADLMSKDFATVQPESTLLEVVFALTVLKRYKVYVVKNGKYAGEIHRTLVLDRIMRL